MNLKHRDQLGETLNDTGLTSVGVEVGSAQGIFASIILSTWKGKKLYLVDPWASQDDAVYVEATNRVAPWDEWYASCERLAKSDSRVELMRGISEEAATKFAPGSIDWVYIDANHDYAHVMQDLDLWVPKVKSGGLVGGHDFYHQVTDAIACEVDAAVLRWTKEHGIPFSVTPCTSWWFIKP